MRATFHRWPSAFLLRLLLLHHPFLIGPLGISGNSGNFKPLSIFDSSQAELALKGMEVSDAIQKDASPILNLVERLNKSTNDLISQVQTMRTHLPISGDTQDTVSAKIEILVAHRATCKSILTDRAATLAQLNSRFQQLMKRRQRIQAVMPEATDFFEQLDRGMKIILDESDLKFNEYQEQANKYDALLEAGLRATKAANL